MRLCRMGISNSCAIENVGVRESEARLNLPNVHYARVEREKVVDYLLSTTNPRGRSKGAFFLRFGFSVASWQRFADALKLQGSAHEVAITIEISHGPRYFVDGIIETLDGRNPFVWTVWQVDSGSDYPRLITAYPRRR